MKQFTALLVFAALFGIQTRAEIIYDNSENFLGQFNRSTVETGDQVQLAGESRSISYFAFEYFASDTVTDSATARVRFYLNDGANGNNPLPTPGTLLYDSGSFTISSGYRTVEISDLQIFVPSDTLTWTVEFSGLTESQRAGVLFYDPPQVGSSADFLWQRQQGAWLAVASNNVTNNLSARFIAVAELKIKSLRAEQSGASVTASATPGKLYSLEYKSSLTQIGWRPILSSRVRATTNQVTLADPGAASAQLRVYRVVETNLSIEHNPTDSSELLITAAATPGRRYTLEFTEDFASWTALAENPAASNTVTFTVTAGPSAYQFFRVSEVRGDGEK